MTVTDVRYEDSRIEKRRVWLVALVVDDTMPRDHPPVRDCQLRIWCHVQGYTYATVDRRHWSTWSQLRARFDLVEAG